MLFDAFIGNRKIIERHRRKLREDRFPHGVIFSGPEGVGKHTCALMVAKALNCLKAEAGDFCDECSSCRKVQSGAHADLSTIGVEGEATQIKIAQVRLFLSTLELAPLDDFERLADDHAHGREHQDGAKVFGRLERPTKQSDQVTQAGQRGIQLRDHRADLETPTTSPPSLARHTG